MSKYMTEMEYVRFKESLRGVIIKIIIGAIIGYFVGGAMMANGSDPDVADRIEGVLMFAGFPYAWTKIPVFAFGMISLIIKFVVAIALGWIITPIALIYDLIQVKAYEKRHFSVKEPEVEIIPAELQETADEDIPRANP